MKFDEKTAVVRSATRHYFEEASGARPCTVRAVLIDDLMSLAVCERVRVEELRVSFGGLSVGGQSFERAITTMTDITDAMRASEIGVADAQRIIVICWQHEDDAR